MKNSDFKKNVPSTASSLAQNAHVLDKYATLFRSVRPCIWNIFFKITKVVLLLGLLNLHVGCTGRKQEKLLEEGQVAVDRREVAKSIRIFKEIIALDPDSYWAMKSYYHLGHTEEVFRKDGNAALVSFKQFLKLSTDPIAKYEVLKRIANIYYEDRNHYQEAIDTYQKLVNENVQSLESDFLRFRLARSYFQNDAFEKARREFQKLVELFPSSQYVARSRFEIGNTYYMESNYTIAIQAFKQVLREHPQSEYAVESQFLIASSLDHGGQWEEAIAIYEGLKGRYPNEILEARMAEAKKRLKR